MDWNNRKVKFAVGLSLIILLIRWWFTGDLLLLVDASASEPAEGSTKTNMIWSVVWPMVVEAIIWVGASAIAWSLQIWQFAFGLVQGTEARAATTEGSTAPQDLVMAVARAIATKDPAIAELSAQLRAPVVRHELVAAVDRSDFAAAKKSMLELEELSQ